MKKILTTRENKGLFFNYALKTRSYSEGKKSNSTGLDPHWVTGLVDAEGSFSVIICKNQKRKLGWPVEPKFQLGLHIRDLSLLLQYNKI